MQSELSKQFWFMTAQVLSSWNPYITGRTDELQKLKPFWWATDNPWYLLSKSCTNDLTMSAVRFAIKSIYSVQFYFVTRTNNIHVNDEPQPRLFFQLVANNSQATMPKDLDTLGASVLVSNIPYWIRHSLNIS